MPSPTALQITALNLRVDAVTAEVARAFRREDIRAILLKGPVVARLIYGDGTRPYVDTDLLVRPSDFDRAEALLAKLGFAPSKEWGDARGTAYYQRHWQRTRDRASVDLHHAVYGLPLPPERVWEILAADTEPLVFAGAEVEALGTVGTTLYLALHAIYSEDEKPLADLRRALDRLALEDWAEAADLARRLDALAWLSAGLRLVERGAAVAEALGLPEEPPLDLSLRDLDAPRQAALLANAWRAGGTRAFVRATARLLVPHASYMRAQFALARRGRVGLAAAYTVRPARLAWRLVPALTGVRRARRA